MKRSLAAIAGLDGFFVSGEMGDAACDFTLGPGGRFQRRPDHHAATRLWVKSLDDDGVTIKYESTFAHRSFGKNLVTVDRGTVHLPWRSS